MVEQLSPKEQGRAAEDKAVVPSRDFSSEFRIEALGAEDSVTVQTLTLEADRVGKDTLDLFKNIPPEVRKIMYVDAFARMVTEGMPHYLNAMLGRKEEVKRALKPKGRLFHELRKAGVELNFTNRPEDKMGRINPFSGRNHIKGVAIDGRVFYLGGVNLVEWTLGCEDFVVKFTGDIAQKLTEQFERIHRGEVTEDYQLPLSENTWLLVDAGTKGKSLILDTAVKKTEEAQKSIKMTSYLMPEGRMVKELKLANKNGKDVKVIASDFDKPDKLLPITTIQFVWLLSQINQAMLLGSKIPIIKYPHHVIHAKLAIWDDKWALFGSHNLSDTGVKAGTMEWSILTCDPVIVDNLIQWYAELREKASRPSGLTTAE